MATTVFTTEYTRADSATPFWHEYASTVPELAAKLSQYDQLLQDNYNVLSITRTIEGNVLRRVVTVNGVTNNLMAAADDIPGYNEAIMNYYNDNNISITSLDMEVVE